jgi:hypothetical protein
MGLAYRYRLGRSARPFPVGFNLLSPLQPLARDRDIAQGFGGASPAPRGARPDRSGRMLYRWHLCGGKKRGHKVAKTKRGKGTILMVIADAHGLPLGLSTRLWLAHMKSPLSNRPSIGPSPWDDPADLLGIAAMRASPPSSISPSL